MILPGLKVLNLKIYKETNHEMQRHIHNKVNPKRQSKIF